MESQAEVQAIAGEGIPGGRVHSAGIGADQQRVLDGVLRGLVSHHPLRPGDARRGVETRPRADRVHDIEILPGHQLGAHEIEATPRQVEGFPGEAALVIRLIRPAQAEVAGEDRPGDAEPKAVALPAPVLVPGLEGAVRGREAASGIAGVDDVVVQQRRTLDELHGRRQRDRLRAVRPTPRAVADIEEDRPQSLAPAHQPADDLQ